MLSRPAFLLLTVLLAGCRPGTGPAGRALTDDLGREVRVPHTVRRIVSLAPSVTETLFAAGAGALVVGVTDADDHPPAVFSIERVQALPLAREMVVALVPDLVVASEQVNDPRDADALAGLGIPTWFVRISTLEDVPRVIRALGELAGTTAAAYRAADSLEAERARLESRRPARDGPSVLLLVSDRGRFSFGRGSYAHDLIALSGGRSVTAELDTRAPIVSDEFVLRAAPDVVVVAMGEDYDRRRLSEAHPTWSLVPAVRSGAVFGVDPDLVLRPGPRLLAGAAAIADGMRRTGTPR